MENALKRKGNLVACVLILIVVCSGIVFADDVVVKEGDMTVRNLSASGNVTATGTGRIDGGIGVGTDPCYALHIEYGEVNIVGNDGIGGVQNDSNAPDVLVVTGGWGAGPGGRGSDIILRAGSAGPGGSLGGLGGDIVLTAGLGGSAQGSGNDGGDLKLTTGTGGFGSHLDGGDGGDCIITTGDGGHGDDDPLYDEGGNGGNIELAPGAGGTGGTPGSYGNILLAKNGGKVLIGMDTADANVAILQVDGTAVADGWVDWTPAWAGTKEQALQSILDITNKDDGKGGVEIDHKTLPDLAYVDLSYYIDVNCITVTEDIEVDGTIYEDVTHEVCDKKLVVKEGRNLGGMITVMVEAIKALEAENQMLREELCSKDPGYSWCK